MEERMVVTVLEIVRLKYATTGLYASRIIPLGLTAYGSTREDADHGVKQMYRSFIKFYRGRGGLAEALNDREVTWKWADEYEGPLTVEYVSDQDIPSHAVQRTSPPAGWRTDPEEQLAVAA